MATSYQWQKNGANLNGASNAALTLNSVSLRDAGTYTCVVTGANGSTNSSAATLTVNGSPPYITSIVPSGANFLIKFTGASGDTPSTSTLVSSPTVSGNYLPAGGANIAQVAPGQFQATVPASGARQFYRIQK